MKIPLSDRLLTCCSFVNIGDRVADVGCDHGYLGIFLLTNGIASSVIASDVNEMPLQSAVINAEKFGVRDRMHFYLSNGVNAIPRDFDTLVCAGMGADTMCMILENALWLKSDRYRLILQCQSKTPMLRKYLYDNGWNIPRETVVKDGRFLYTVMEAVREEYTITNAAEYFFSSAMLRDNSPEVPAYFHWVTEQLRRSVDGTGDPEKKTILETLQTSEIYAPLRRKDHDNGK